jgi:hypothetical protein
MLVHTVVFWGKPNLTIEQRAAFRAGLETLRKVPSVSSVYIGAPAAVPERPVIDRSFTFCLTIVFKDVQAHNDYQVHPTHVAFVESCKQYWERVQIYDAE